MDLFSFILLGGGLAFFLYGMHVLSTGLSKLTGGKLEHTLRSITSNKWKALLLGAGITIAIQSSSAMTVMLVGLVNSGIMNLGQSVGLIMGSNIGTTLTAWILSLAGIESDSIVLGLLKPENFSLIFALFGVGLIMVSKQQRRRDIGEILLGFAVLMYGMKMMSSAVKPLANSPQFSSLLTMFANPLLGVLAGALFTGLIQSSAASVGILQALALTGSITYGMAIPIIMGQNIGTCVTALISSIGVSRNARRVSIIHISFNLFGTLFCLLVFYLLHYVFRFSFIDLPIDALGIAFCHSVFNIATTAVLLPFSSKLVLLAEKLIPSRKETETTVFLDERLLRTPGFAVAEAEKHLEQMATTARMSIDMSLELLPHYNAERAAQLVDMEQTLDDYEDHLGTFLVQVSSRNLSAADSLHVSRGLHLIGDFERIGDHAVNLQYAAKELYDKKISFSEDAAKELKVLSNAVREVVHMAMKAYLEDNITQADYIEPLEEVIDNRIAESRRNHIERLRRGECTIELGFILNDVLSDFERISDHCSNIAVCLMQAAENSFDTHNYLNERKNQAEFRAQCEHYDKLYRFE